MANQPPQELRNQTEQLVKRVDQLQGMLDKAGRAGPIVWTCLVIGVALIASTVLKSWLSTPNKFDWGLLFVGFILCVISLLKKFKIGLEGVEGEVKDVLMMAKDLVTKLAQWQ